MQSKTPFGSIKEMLKKDVFSFPCQCEKTIHIPPPFYHLWKINKNVIFGEKKKHILIKKKNIFYYQNYTQSFRS